MELIQIIYTLINLAGYLFFIVVMGFLTHFVVNFYVLWAYEDLSGVHSAILPYADDGFYATELEDRSMNIVTSKKAKAMQNHPIIKKHNESKLDTLFVNPVYTVGIDSKSDDEAASLLASLYEHILQDKYIYRHKWSEDTLLMWDNRSVMHMAEGGYDSYDRLLHRITIAG